MRRWLYRLLVLAVLVSAAVALRSTVLAPRPIPVSVVRAQRGTVEATVTNSKAGTVKARQRANLSPEVSGLVVEITRRKGEPVKRGEMLLRLNDVTQVAQIALARQVVAVAEAGCAKAMVARDFARRVLERHQRLLSTQLEPADLKDQLQTAVAEAEAECRARESEVLRAEAALAVAEAELIKTRIVAPFDGIVADRKCEVGEWITPAPPLFQVPSVIDILDPASLYVSAPMDEVDSGRIRAGQRVWVALDPYPGRRFGGKVARVAPYVLDVEAQNRTVEIEVELEDREFSSGLLPGTSADVEVILEVRDDVLRIPTEALLEGNKVFVVEGDHVVERALEVGLRNWNFTEVAGGLVAGEPIVISLDRPEVKAGAWVAAAAPRGP
ncbi:MAG: efflux RND transporter periplasmic adaptor subunit [Planctomycetes bacterium]|nr:efflux RND transporter periplasmic adaptor subunit [Planctomycetota bacterium]